MKASDLRRWCRPRTILVISNLTENPAHTLEVVTGIRELEREYSWCSYQARPTPRPDSALVSPVSCSPRPERSRNHDSETEIGKRSCLWAEILSEVTVLKNTPIERIPALADSLGADLEVLTAPEIGFIRFCTGKRPGGGSVWIHAGAHSHLRCAHEDEFVEREGIPQNSFTDLVRTRPGTATAIGLPILRGETTDASQFCACLKTERRTNIRGNGRPWQWKPGSRFRS